MGDVREEQVGGGAAPWFLPEDEGALRDFWSIYGDSLEVLGAKLLRRLALHSQAQRTERSDGEDVPAQVERVLRAWGPRGAGAWHELETTLQQCQQAFAAWGGGIAMCADAYGLIADELTPRLITAYAAEPARLAASLRVLQRYTAHSLSVLSESSLQAKERLLVAQQRQTEQASARYTRLAESGMLGILVCDFHGNIVEANDGFLHKFGYSHEDLLAGEVRWAEMTPSEWKHLDEEAVEQLLSVGKTRAWEKEYFHKDGNRIPVLVGVAMLNDSQTIAFVLDISERKRLEEIRGHSLELQMQNRRIQEASRLKSEFLANMSHELRTPLNSILGFAELLYDREIDPASPQYRESLQDILTSGRHLQQLINDVLDLAKVEAGKIELRPQEVDIAQLIVEVSAVLRTVAAGKRIRITIDVAEEVARATLDPGRFKQVLYNYLSNALKFTLEGGKVTVRAVAESPDQLRLIVADTGIGIASADLGRLFVEFQQLEAGATKKHGGTGLGLALTKRLVEAQGGSVGVKSVLGQGSQFFAILPRHCVVTVQAAQSLPDEYHAPSNGGALVLVVEDDARDRALLVQTLSRAGYGVQGAATGGQAIEWCAQQLFDAITLDLLLPDMTGLDVLHRVRVAGKNRETPVVVVSVVAEQGILGGFSVQDCLTKPVDGQDLLEALERAAVPPDKKGRVLVVDDDPAAHRLMRATLEKLGYRVQCSSSGEEALALAAAEQPLAIVLDLMMPGIDGFEFLIRFRAESQNRSVPVIVWTMKDLDIDEHRKLRQLAQRVIAKNDWTPALFLEEVRGLIAEQQRVLGSEVS